MSNRIDINELIKEYGESIRSEISRSSNKSEVYMTLDGIPAMRDRKDVEYFPGLGWTAIKTKSNEQN